MLQVILVFCLFSLVLNYISVARGEKEGIAEPRDGRCLPVALEARVAGDERRRIQEDKN